MKSSKVVKSGDLTRAEKLPASLPQIDILKGLAIIAVVLLHTLPMSMFLLIGAPYHLWQAVPLFIVIAGFTGAYTYKRYGSKTLKECYDPLLLARRLRRLLVPFLICWIVELCFMLGLKQVSFDIGPLLVSLMGGGYGWGAFFIPLIIQSLLIVPILYLVATRNPDRMLLVALFLNLFFDAVVVVFGWDGSITAALYFRYLFAGALGIWIVTSAKTDKRWILFGGMISLIYITISCYTSLLSAFPDFSGYAAILQAPAFMWAFILVLTGLKSLSGKIELPLFRIFGELGKASWHIFLVQLIYYLYPAAFVYALINGISDLFMSGAPLSVLQYLLAVILNLGICLSLGYGWYVLGKRISRKKQTPTA